MLPVARVSQHQLPSAESISSWSGSVVGRWSESDRWSCSIASWHAAAEESAGNFVVTRQRAEFDDARAADDRIADDVRWFVELVPLVFSMNGDDDFVMGLAADEPAPILLRAPDGSPRIFDGLAVDVAQCFELDVSPEANAERFIAAAARRGREFGEDVADIGPGVPLAANLDPTAGSKGVGTVGGANPTTA